MPVNVYNNFQSLSMPTCMSDAGDGISYGRMPETGIFPSDHNTLNHTAINSSSSEVYYMYGIPLSSWIAAHHRKHTTNVYLCSDLKGAVRP